MTSEMWWIALGLTGQLLFTARFLVQWLSSERQGRSVIPLAFWYFSIGGSLLLLTYAVYRRDPVFMLGQGLGMAIYLRNLQLIFRQHQRSLAAVRPPAEAESAPLRVLEPSSPGGSSQPSDSPPALPSKAA